MSKWVRNYLATKITTDIISLLRAVMAAIFIHHPPHFLKIIYFLFFCNCSKKKKIKTQKQEEKNQNSFYPLPAITVFRNPPPRSPLVSS
jgi:flagellar basal body-associated protein FliL